MENTVNLKLTKEQAALLAPILQQMLPINPLQETDRREDGRQLTASLPLAYAPDNQHSSQTPDDQQLTAEMPKDCTDENIDNTEKESELEDEQPIAGIVANDSESNFTVKELLQKKKRNEKSTRAQNFLNVRNANT